MKWNSIAQLTGEGLTWIAALVFLLWGCILVENSIVKHSRVETARILLDLQRLRHATQVIPAAFRSNS